MIVYHTMINIISIATNVNVQLLLPADIVI